MNTALIAALLSFIAWVVLAWVVAVPVPAVHLLLALGATLVVYGVGRRA
ncbi:MAG TPA: hypothetical protein VFO96_02645 [Gemmatimonadales bacterium]|jgi:hypothetical protein|nr:hypothetical protein [Gemmatimonadales bacterium]